MVLNPVLYAQLTDLQGEAPKVVNEGVPFAYVVKTLDDGRSRVHPTAGEQYAVNCPFCGDSRKRLFVHHRFGTDFSDPAYPWLRGKLVHLAFCQNEQRIKPLYGLLANRGSFDPHKVELMMSLQPPPKADAVFRSIPPMGELHPLQDLPVGHPAVQYLLGRGYDPAMLGRIYGAGVSVGHPDPTIRRMVDGRITFPFYVDGVLAGWQSRLAYDLPKGKRWPPKWYFPPGTKKVPWNVDLASTFSTVIICEGILSAVNAGPAAIAIGGKTLTYDCRDLVTKRWRRAIVMLDPDAGINRHPDEEDWQQRVASDLRSTGIDVREVQWTAGDNRDPGDIGPAGCADVIQRSAPDLYASLGYFG